MHLFEINDDQGDLVDVVVFCSDYCHRLWCIENKQEYQGWNGCHEPWPSRCASCDALIMEEINDYSGN